MIYKLTLYTSPFIIGILYKKGYTTPESWVGLTKVVTGLGVILVVSFCIRSLGRCYNPLYLKFNKSLLDAQANWNSSTKMELARYDFEFYSWPIEFRWNEVEGDGTKRLLYIQKPMTNRNVIQKVTALPCHVIGYLAIHTFGIGLIYPGSILPLQMVICKYNLYINLY